MSNNTKSVDAATKARTGNIGLIVLSLLFMLNPVVRVVDILPDFIACAIIVRMLGYAADRAPFFEEARADFLKLCFVSLAKIPAFFIISIARNSNTLDNDTTVLFTFVFSLVEIILLRGAITNLFAGLYHLGQRTEAAATIRPFPVSKSGEKQATPEGARAMALVFVVVRAVLTAAPELLLLTRSNDGGKYQFNLRALYPYAIVISVLAVLIFGAVIYKRAVAYTRAINGEGLFPVGLEAMVDGDRRRELEKKIAGRRMRAALTLLIAASFLTFELRFDNFGSVNLLPHFIFGALLIAAALLIGRYTDRQKPTVIAASVYSAVALVGYILEIRFSDKHGFDALVRDGAARDAYLPLIVFSALELCALACTMVFLARQLVEFSVRHTGLDPLSDRYGRQEKEFHATMKKRIFVYCGVGTLVGLLKLLDTIFKYYSERTYVDLGDTIGTVVSGVAPWFGVVLVIASGVFIGLSLFVIGALKTESEAKYS